VTDAKAYDDAKREFEKLDFTRLHFPSDHVTIFALRRLQPQFFDHGFPQGDDREQPQYFLRENTVGLAQDGIGTMMFCERLIATWAYAAARGVPPPLGWTLAERKAKLVEAYCFHKLASGPHEAIEMVKDIERQGIQLANQIGR
jgi:hypothetical protein